MRREDSFNPAAPAARSKCKRKEGDSEEDEDEEDDSEDQRDDDDEEEEEPAAKREKKADACEEEVSDKTITVHCCLSTVVALTRPHPPGHQGTVCHGGGAGEADWENTQGEYQSKKGCP